VKRDAHLMHANKTLTEADRLMTVCNSCRYCEGLCAVFPAMERRRVFNDRDLHYLANLCHSCGACYIDCQYSPPHEFNVNVPATFAAVRKQSYAAYAWPHALSGFFERNGLAISLIAALSVAGFVVGFVAFRDPKVLFGAQNAGSFYALMPHDTMVGLFGLAFSYAVFALIMGGWKFWNDLSDPPGPLPPPRSVWQAMKDAAQLRYLDGGGAGCYNAEDSHADHRRLYHHFTFYGFLLCFAATVTGTLYHYLLHREPPFPLWDIPVVLGTLGGIGLVIGPAGLLFSKRARDPILNDASSSSMDAAFLGMLSLSNLTGLALLLLRATPAMGITLAVHLGAVFALFLTMPYGKFVHGIYRLLALVYYARESDPMAGGLPAGELVHISGLAANKTK
jgi:citrate/tricarballylate utilization protein